MIDEPFVGVSLEAHGGGHDDSGHHQGPADSQAAEIETMLKVLAAIQNDAMPTTPLSLDAGPGIRQRRERISMRFELPDAVDRYWATRLDLEAKGQSAEIGAYNGHRQRSFSTPFKRSHQAALGRLKPAIELCRRLRADHGLEVADGCAGGHEFRDVHFDHRHQNCFGLRQIIASRRHQAGNNPRRGRAK